MAKNSPTKKQLAKHAADLEAKLERIQNLLDRSAFQQMKQANRIQLLMDEGRLLTEKSAALEKQAAGLASADADIVEMWELTKGTTDDLVSQHADLRSAVTELRDQISKLEESNVSLVEDQQRLQAKIDSFDEAKSPRSAVTETEADPARKLRSLPELEQKATDITAVFEKFEEGFEQLKLKENELSERARTLEAGFSELSDQQKKVVLDADRLSSQTDQLSTKIDAFIQDVYVATSLENRIDMLLQQHHRSSEEIAEVKSALDHSIGKVSGHETRIKSVEQRLAKLDSGRSVSEATSNVLTSQVEDLISTVGELSGNQDALEEKARLLEFGHRTQSGVIANLDKERKWRSAILSIVLGLIIGGLVLSHLTLRKETDSLIASVAGIEERYAVQTNQQNRLESLESKLQQLDSGLKQLSAGQKSRQAAESATLSRDIETLSQSLSALTERVDRETSQSSRDDQNLREEQARLSTEMDTLTASVGTIEKRLRTLVESRLEPVGAGPLLARLDNAGYAIQLIGVHKKELLLDFVRVHGLHDNSGVFHTEFNGKDWHVLLYGFYPTFREAKRKLDNLPEPLKSLHPWIRPIGDQDKIDPFRVTSVE